MPAHLPTSISTFPLSSAARHRHSGLAGTSALSLWLSVDPLSDKYPNLSPYVYCANNPVRLVDADGREIDEWDFNIITGECQWVSGKGGVMVDYINVHDGNGNLLETAIMGNNTNEKTVAWSAQDFGPAKWRSLYLSDGANEYTFSNVSYPTVLSNTNQSIEVPHAIYGQSNSWVSDISFGTALEGGMVSEAARLSGETSFLKGCKIGGGILSTMGGGISTYKSACYAVQNPSAGSYARMIVQGASTILGCFGGWATIASIGLTAFDYYFGEKFYNWLDE